MTPSPQAAAAALAAAVRRRLGPPPELGDWPLVSIVVLNRDGAALLRRLLAGLTERTDYPHLEMIAVDNASSDDSLDFLRRVEAPFPIQIVANAHNESFSDGCNQGAELASGELLLFLNNDVEPFEPGWLRELVACVCGSAAAAAGPTLIEPADDAAPPDYRIEQRGHRVGEVDGALVPRYRDRGEDPLGTCLGEDAEVAVLSAACLLVEREAFDRVEGFTHGFWYGGEDTDLALKLRQAGMSARCAGRSLLVHPPNSTLRSVSPEERREWGRGNRRLFAELWGPRVRREYALDCLRGGGLWAEPGAALSPTWGATEDRVGALGFCCKSAVAPAEVAVTPPLPELVVALQRRGRRAVLLQGEEVDSLSAFDYDVVVHLGGAYRYAPRAAQLNILWLPTAVAPPHPLERSRYDLVLDAAASSPCGPDALAKELIDASERVARERGYNPRVEPERGPALTSSR